MILLKEHSPICSVCGALIMGVYYIDAYGNKACERHYGSLIHCASCGCFCGKDAVSVTGDLVICKDCHDNIPSDEECKRIIRHIRRKYRSLPIGTIPSFRLYRIPADAWTEGKRTTGLAINSGKNYSIKVPAYLSKTTLAEVLAHEMLHLWLYERNCRKSARIIEGFCNLGSFEILRSIKTEKARVKIKSIEGNPDATYGDGFRIVKKTYESSGWEGVITKILASKK